MIGADMLILIFFSFAARQLVPTILMLSQWMLSHFVAPLLENRWLDIALPKMELNWAEILPLVTSPTLSQETPAMEVSIISTMGSGLWHSQDRWPPCSPSQRTTPIPIPCSYSPLLPRPPTSPLSSTAPTWHLTAEEEHVCISHLPTRAGTVMGTYNSSVIYLYFFIMYMIIYDHMCAN